MAWWGISAQHGSPDFLLSTWFGEVVTDRACIFLSIPLEDPAEWLVWTLARIWSGEQRKEEVGLPWKEKEVGRNICVVYGKGVCAHWSLIDLWVHLWVQMCWVIKQAYACVRSRWGEDMYLCRESLEIQVGYILRPWHSQILKYLYRLLLKN